MTANSLYILLSIYYDLTHSFFLSYYFQLIQDLISFFRANIYKIFPRSVIFSRHIYSFLYLFYKHCRFLFLFSPVLGGPVKLATADFDLGLGASRELQFKLLESENIIKHYECLITNRDEELNLTKKVSRSNWPHFTLLVHFWRKNHLSSDPVSIYIWRSDVILWAVLQNIVTSVL